MAEREIDPFGPRWLNAAGLLLMLLGCAGTVGAIAQRVSCAPVTITVGGP